ncbi:hypothetical protein DL768_005578 [Monosporascus sp. mg162]|nr:hypothetical protein DL768_005578 [Monosporascus sp. mg162]
MESPETANEGGGVLATSEIIIGELGRLYWETVKGEAQSMIEFHLELVRSDLDLSHQIDPDTQCNNFKKMFDVWLGGQAGFDKDSTADIYDETIRRARAMLRKHMDASSSEPTNDHERAARFVLQSSNSREYRVRLGKAQPDRNPDGSDNTSSDWKARVAEKALTWTEVGAYDLRAFLRTVGLMTKGHYAPAGNFHLSVMFGPLILESGLPEIYRGVLVSPRPPPTLFTNNLAEEEPRKAKCPFFYRHKATGQPEFRRKEMDIQPRPLLASLKRVYAGAFSGYPETAGSREANAIRCLIREAERYGKIPSSKTVTARQKALEESARRLTEELKKCIGTEVNKHLTRIADILLERNAKWSMVTNNCQLLANSLLMGKDFEYIIPRFPSNLGKKSNDDDFHWPRYLISFGNHIEGFGKSFYQANCLMTNYCQSNPTIDYDLLEYVSWRSEQSSDPSLELDPFSQALGELSLLNYSPDTAPLPVEQLWLMPNDSLSLLQFHLLRQPHKYRASSKNRLQHEEWLKNRDALNSPLRGKEWLRNRLAVMQLLDVFASFTGALGVSLFNLFVREPQLLKHITIPPSRVLGNMRADEKLRILRGLGSRGVIYDITNRVPNAMAQVVNLRRRLSGDPIYGEEVLCRIVGFFVAPIALVSPAAAKEVGGSFRLHNGYWITVNVGGHTYVTQYLGRKVKNTRD